MHKEYQIVNNEVFLGFKTGFEILNTNERLCESKLNYFKYNIEAGYAQFDGKIFYLGGGTSRSFKAKSFEIFGIK